jgi:hypothetical protein
MQSWKQSGAANADDGATITPKAVIRALRRDTEIRDSGLWDEYAPTKLSLLRRRQNDKRMQQMYENCAMVFNQFSRYGSDIIHTLSKRCDVGLLA